MRTAIRRCVAGVVVLHGLIHLLGAAKGLGWADVTVLKAPIGPAAGIAWLAAAALVIAAGALLALGSRRWWLVGVAAVTASQAVILTAWADARAGTLANLVLLVAVVYGYASQGPSSYRAQYRNRVATITSTLTGSDPATAVTDADLAHLPEPVAAYVRQSGAVSQAHVTCFHARMHGRIRAGATKPWMTFTGEQVSTYGADPSRLFLMDATMAGLPVDVLHDFVGRSARMRVKVCSLVPVVHADGPDMDRAETATLFNDLCVLAPAALLDASVVWQAIDDHHVLGAFTKGAHTVTATLVFNDDRELVDFVSDDRRRTAGHDFVPQQWSTPIGHYQSFGNRRIASRGAALWHAPDPEGTFAYLDLTLDDITYNLDNTSSDSTHPTGHPDVQICTEPSQHLRRTLPTAL